MRSHGLLLATFLLATAACAQVPDWWTPTDTLTRGGCQDYHPVIRHNSFQEIYGRNEVWMIFERHCSGTVSIAGRRIETESGLSDTAVYVISSSPEEELQTLPDYVDVTYASPPDWTQHLFRVAAWQKRVEGRWTLLYSSLFDTNTTWSVPRRVVNDTVDNTNVQVRGTGDSTILITWKRQTALMGAYLAPSSLSYPETLGVSSTPEFEYDVMSDWAPRCVMWTTQDSVGKNLLVFRGPNYGPAGGFGAPETLQLPLSASSPHLIVDWEGPSVLFEADSAGDRDVFASSEYFWGVPMLNVSGDPGAADGNARGFNSPVITRRTLKGLGDPVYWAVVAYEKCTIAESLLVFLQYGTYADTVRSPGFNRDVCVGSSMLGGDFQNLYVWGVWESNRTGASHIYGRRLRIVIDDVEDEGGHPAAIHLEQNYPNPFNALTVVSFHLPVASEVRLVVYDVLGREVSVLADGRRAAGSYELRFDASGLASGVYLYRLEAPGWSTAKKAILVR